MKKSETITFRTTKRLKTKINTLANVMDMSQSDVIKHLLLNFEHNSDSQEIIFVSSLIVKINQTIINLEAQRDYSHLSSKASQFLEVLYFAEQLLIRTPLLVDNPDNYVYVPDEMLEIGQKPHKSYKYAIVQNLLADETLKKIIH